jgi:predicted kinase
MSPAAQLGRADFAKLALAKSLTPLANAISAGSFDALLPGLRLELNIPQRTRWHALSVLRHSAATAELLPATLESRVTGLLHDLGKRVSAAPNARGEDSYIGHPERGAAMAGKYLAVLGFGEPERERIIRRIRLHMVLHEASNFAISDKSLDKVLDKLGGDIGPLSDLTAADTATMSPHVARAKLGEEENLQVRLLRRAADRGIAPWPRFTRPVSPHPVALAAVKAGTAHVPTSEDQAKRERDINDQVLINRLGLAPSATTPKPYLIMAAGLPASGKSHFARALTTRVPSVVHLSSDSVRMALTNGKPVYTGGEAAFTHGTVGRLARHFLSSGHSVIIDATGVRPRDRKTALEAAGGRPTVLVWCEADEATANARFAKRAHGSDPLDHSQADAAVRARMAAVTTRPTAAEAGQVFYVSAANLEPALERLRMLLDAR